MLGKPGVTRFGLAIAWLTFGLVDLVYAVIDAALGGQVAALNALLGPAIGAIPIGIVVQLATLVLLLSSSVSGYMARTPAN